MNMDGTIYLRSIKKLDIENWAHKEHYQNYNEK